MSVKTKSMSAFGTNESKVPKFSNDDKKSVDAATLDEQCKRLLRRVEFVAPIVRSVVPEFYGCNLQDVAKSMSISEIDEKILGIGVEDLGMPDEALVRYDSLTDINLPNGVHTVFTGLVFNTEVQHTEYLQYFLGSRAQYYVARLLSRQLSKIGNNGEGYNKLQPVYTVWIVRDAHKQLAGQVLHYVFRDDTGKTFVRGDDTDFSLMHIVMIYLPKLKKSENYLGDDELINYLLSVFTGKLEHSSLTKLIQASADVMKEVDDMMTADEARILQGREEGREEGIKVLAETLLDIQKDETFILKTISDKFKISKEEARNILNW